MSSSIVAPVFTGVSSYASDLQSVISRAVNIAAMPLHQMQNQLQGMTNKASALTGLDTTFSRLQTAVQGLDTALGTSSYFASSSDSSLVAPAVSSGAMEASYTLSVSDIGSYSAAVSSATLPAVADPYSASISASTDFTLTVDGKTFNIKPHSAGLLALAQAINSASAGVQASIVNTGSTGAPQYRLALRSINLGPDSIQLNDGSQDLLDSLGTGQLASYTVNGLGGTIQSSSRTITLAPGVTANLLGVTTSGQPLTVTVSRNADSLSSAISNFVSAYNSAVDALGQQFGPNAGALSGQSIVRDLTQTMRSITQFTASSGAVASLAQMGLALDSLGHLSFDTTQFSSSSIVALQSFMGSATTDGFLKNAIDALAGVEDATNGSLKLAIEQSKVETDSQNTLIADEVQRITDMQANLTQQMAVADALIASLESQKSYMSNLFTAMMNSNTSGVKSS
jgi:flagellar hook-associated protein 2